MYKQQEEFIDAVLKQCRDLLIRKGDDYNNEENTLAVFNSLNDVSITADTVILSRIMDKIERIKTFYKKGFYSVADEKLRDTVIDTVNYLILLLLFLETKNKNPT